jgi:hypothetical protein
MSDNQRAFLDLAAAVDMQTAPPASHVALLAKHRTIHAQGDAAAYIRQVETKIHSRRISKL